MVRPPGGTPKKSDGKRRIDQPVEDRRPSVPVSQEQQLEEQHARNMALAASLADRVRNFLNPASSTSASSSTPAADAPKAGPSGVQKKRKAAEPAEATPGGKKTRRKVKFIT